MKRSPQRTTTKPKQTAVAVDSPATRFARLATDTATQPTPAAKPINLGTTAEWEKDVLAPGDYSAPEGKWNVTPAELQAITSNFTLAQSRGIRVPVILAQAGGSQHEELAGHKVGEVKETYVRDGKLFCKLWTRSASNPVVYQLDLLNQQVSVEVWKNWTDGQGNRYPLFLKHLAIVTHPVVHPQGEFVRTMSLNGRRIRMADEVTTDGGSAASDDVVAAVQYDASSTLGDIFSELTGALAELGMMIPPDVTPETFMLTLKTMVSLKKASETATDDAAVSDAPAADASLAADGGAVQMSLANNPQFAALLAENRALKAAKVEQAKAIFQGSLIGHARRGAIGQALVQQLTADGAKFGYSMALLSPLELLADGAALPTGKTNVRRMAVGTPPAMSADPSPKPMTDERAKQLAAQTRRW